MMILIKDNENVIIEKIINLCSVWVYFLYEYKIIKIERKENFIMSWFLKKFITSCLLFVYCQYLTYSILNIM